MDPRYSRRVEELLERIQRTSSSIICSVNDALIEAVQEENVILCKQTDEQLQEVESSPLHTVQQQQPLSSPCHFVSRRLPPTSVAAASAGEIRSNFSPNACTNHRNLNTVEGSTATSINRDGNWAVNEIDLHSALRQLRRDGQLADATSILAIRSMTKQDMEKAVKRFHNQQAERRHRVRDARVLRVPYMMLLETTSRTLGIDVASLKETLGARLGKGGEGEKSTDSAGVERGAEKPIGTEITATCAARSTYNGSHSAISAPKTHRFAVNSAGVVYSLQLLENQLARRLEHHRRLTLSTIPLTNSPFASHLAGWTSALQLPALESVAQDANDAKIGNCGAGNDSHASPTEDEVHPEKLVTAAASSAHTCSTDPQNRCASFSLFGGGESLSYTALSREESESFRSATQLSACGDRSRPRRMVRFIEDVTLTSLQSTGEVRHLGCRAGQTKATKEVRLSPTNQTPFGQWEEKVGEESENGKAADRESNTEGVEASVDVATAPEYDGKDSTPDEEDILITFEHGWGIPRGVRLAQTTSCIGATRSTSLSQPSFATVAVPASAAALWMCDSAAAATAAEFEIKRKLMIEDNFSDRPLVMRLRTSFVDGSGGATEAAHGGTACRASFGTAGPLWTGVRRARWLAEQWRARNKARQAVEKPELADEGAGKDDSVQSVCEPCAGKLAEDSLDMDNSSKTGDQTSSCDFCNSTVTAQADPLSHAAHEVDLGPGITPRRQATRLSSILAAGAAKFQEHQQGTPRLPVQASREERNGDAGDNTKECAGQTLRHICNSSITNTNSSSSSSPSTGAFESLGSKVKVLADALHVAPVPQGFSESSPNTQDIPSYQDMLTEENDGLTDLRDAPTPVRSRHGTWKSAVDSRRESWGERHSVVHELERTCLSQERGTGVANNIATCSSGSSSSSSENVLAPVTRRTNFTGARSPTKVLSGSCTSPLRSRTRTPSPFVGFEKDSVAASGKRCEAGEGVRLVDGGEQRPSQHADSIQSLHSAPIATSYPSRRSLTQPRRSSSTNNSSVASPPSRDLAASRCEKRPVDSDRSPSAVSISGEAGVTLLVAQQRSADQDVPTSYTQPHFQPQLSRGQSTAKTRQQSPHSPKDQASFSAPEAPSAPSYCGTIGQHYAIRSSSCEKTAGRTTTSAVGVRIANRTAASVIPSPPLLFHSKESDAPSARVVTANLGASGVSATSDRLQLPWPAPKEQRAHVEERRDPSQSASGSCGDGRAVSGSACVGGRESKSIAGAPPTSCRKARQQRLLQGSTSSSLGAASTPVVESKSGSTMPVLPTTTTIISRMPTRGEVAVATTPNAETGVSASVRAAAVGEMQKRAVEKLGYELVAGSPAHVDVDSTRKRALIKKTCGDTSARLAASAAANPSRHTPGGVGSGRRHVAHDVHIMVGNKVGKPSMPATVSVGELTKLSDQASPNEMLRHSLGKNEGDGTQLPSAVSAPPRVHSPSMTRESASTGDSVDERTESSAVHSPSIHITHQINDTLSKHPSLEGSNILGYSEPLPTKSTHNSTGGWSAQREYAGSWDALLSSPIKHLGKGHRGSISGGVGPTSSGRLQSQARRDKNPTNLSSPSTRDASQASVQAPGPRVSPCRAWQNRGATADRNGSVAPVAKRQAASARRAESIYYRLRTITPARAYSVSNTRPISLLRSDSITRPAPSTSSRRRAGHSSSKGPVMELKSQVRSPSSRMRHRTPLHSRPVITLEDPKERQD